MSEKHLTEAPWKQLVTKQDIEDPGLGKALAAYGKADEEDYEARLKAIEGIEDEAEGLKKEHKKNKDVAGYLDEVLKQADKTRKEIEALQKEGGGDDDDGEAEEYKKDLKKKMVSAMTQVKGRAPGATEPGEEGKAQLQFMAYVASGASAVIVGRKVGGATKKLLPEIAGGASGGKYIRGECIFEKNVHTFVVEKVPGGLAKKLSKALFAETGIKYKVRVRSLDGAQETDSDTDTDADEIPAAPPPPPASDLAAKYQQRLKAIMPGLQRALKEQLGDTGKMRAVAEFMREKAGAKNYDSALKALDALEKLLTAAGVVAGQSTPSQAPPPQSSPPQSTAGGDERAQWEKQFAEFEALYLEATKGGAPNPEIEKLLTRLRTIWNFATAQAEAGDLKKALAAFQRIESEKLFAAITAGKSAQGAPSGLVEKRKFMLTRWQQIPPLLGAELNNLKKAIVQQVPDEDDAEDITTAMDDYLEAMLGEIQDQIDKAINAGDMSLLNGLKQRVQSDNLVKLLVSNPFVQGSKFESLVIDALNEIESELAA